MFFLLYFFMRAANSHSIGVMVNSTFPIMDEVIRVWAMSEFVRQVGVKLISSGGAYKHSFALKPLAILNTGPTIIFLLTSLSTFFVTKIPFWECWSVPQGSFVLLSFYGGLLVVSWFKIFFYMPLFVRFSFWAPTRFPKVNHLRYGPVLKMWWAW